MQITRPTQNCTSYPTLEKQGKLTSIRIEIYPGILFAEIKAAFPEFSPLIGQLNCQQNLETSFLISIGSLTPRYKDTVVPS
jgi:hypothetical protein